MGGDLNFTTIRKELWGFCRKEDMMTNYFLNNF
jgi:hypothetical protein